MMPHSLSSIGRTLFLSLLLVVLLAPAAGAQLEFIDVRGYGCFTAAILNTTYKELGKFTKNSCIYASSSGCQFANKRQADSCLLFIPSPMDNEAKRNECTKACTPCGNGILDVGEECDDSGTTDGDGCSATCRFEEVYCCSNGVQTPLTPLEKSSIMLKSQPLLGTSCENINATFASDSVTVKNQATPCLCGNQNVDPGETCDLGYDPFGYPNNIEEYGCSPTCKQMMCGNKILNDGKAAPASWIVSKLEPFTWAIHPTNLVSLKSEQCDDGNRKDGDDCNSNCQLCGNINVDPGEQCDLGQENSQINGCTLGCEKVCGDGKVDKKSYVVDRNSKKTWWEVDGDWAKEQCDDKNIIENDACDNHCQEVVGACCSLEQTGLYPHDIKTETECKGYGIKTTYWSPADMKVSGPVTKEMADKFCTAEVDEMYCCGTKNNDYKPVLLSQNYANCAAAKVVRNDVYGDGPIMNRATAIKACKPVYCEGFLCEEYPKFHCSIGFDKTWQPPAGSAYMPALTWLQAQGKIKDVRALGMCQLWEDFDNLMNLYNQNAP